MIHHVTLTSVWVAGITLVSLTVPLLLELLLVSVAASVPGRKSRRREPTLPAVQRLIVIVPSHNEEGSIARCIESIAASAHGTENILVIAHNCEDNTRQFGAKRRCKCVRPRRFESFGQRLCAGQRI